MKRFVLLFTIALSGCIESPLTKRCSSYEECPQLIDFYRYSAEEKAKARKRGSPVPVYKAQPIYPTEALVNHTEGYVIVEYLVNNNGDPVNLSIVESIPTGFFEEAAIEAAKHFKYEKSPQEYKNIRTKVSFKIDKDQPSNKEKFLGNL
ncbi:energy transducer TonB [uncultured Microbulbifer sp.]|uniref:energy transducer TonB n=1 Tax=uncultured Microbulbifer sp. TaxID=348147 RepID=UPI0026116AB0|nr:energy transducer TonB [uncultured Microbulbifer sp.]